MMRFLLAASLLITTPAAAVNLVLDYTYDSQNFFGAGNPDGAAAGAQAKARLEEAASFFSAILDDSFSPIQTPPDYVATSSGGAPRTTTWGWSVQFPNPSTGLTVSLTDPAFAEDEYRIYAGGRSLSGSLLGIGGFGGYDPDDVSFNPYTASELAEMQEITRVFYDSIQYRGDSTGGFSRWGGSITFDNDGSSNWHYGADDDLAFDESDFLSVALHELGHALGFGTADEFSALRSGSFFIGPASTAANGGTNPRLDSGGGHWQDGTKSTIYGTSTTKETAMGPIITSGDRKLFTELDAAALEDIGWEVIDLPTVDLPGDYNGDNVVDAADYTVWRDGDTTGGTYSEWSDNYGRTAAASGATIPEPTALALLVFGLAACRQRR